MAEISVPRLLAEAGLVIQDNRVVLPNWCNRIKIDVGLAFNAPQSGQWLEEDLDLIVIGFEPVKANVEALRHGIQEHSHIKYVKREFINSRLFIIEAALGEQTREQNIYVTSNDPGCSSLLNPVNFDVDRVETVSVVTLDEILDHFTFDRISYIEHLKTDCQGTDFEVLMGARNYLDKIVAVTCEVESLSYHNSQNTYSNISNLLRNHYFKPINNSPNLVLAISKRFDDALIKNILRKVYKKLYKSKFRKTNLGIQDPTFVNKKYENLITEGKVKLFQEG
jgi:FkbM family methyltransferase